MLSVVAHNCSCKLRWMWGSLNSIHQSLYCAMCKFRWKFNW